MALEDARCDILFFLSAGENNFSNKSAKCVVRILSLRETSCRCLNKISVSPAFFLQFWFWWHVLAASTTLYYTAKEGPVRIQYKCLVPIYVFPEMKLLFPKQNYNVLSLSSFTHISVRDLSISRIGLLQVGCPRNKQK